MVAEGYRRHILERVGSLGRGRASRFYDLADDMWRYSRKYGEAWFLPRLLFHSDRLGMRRFLYDDSGRLLETLLAGDRTAFKSFIDGAVERAVEEFHREVESFNAELESSLENFDEYHRQLVQDIRAVDRITSDIPRVAREGLTFHVDGKIASYEVGLLSGEVSAACHGNHTREHICIMADGNIEEVGEERIENPMIKRSIQIALNLINDEKIGNGGIFDRLHRVVMCPRCYIDGKIPAKAVEAFLNAIASKNQRAIGTVNVDCDA